LFLLAPGVLPQDIEEPDLTGLWQGSATEVRVPSGYALSTYPDG